MIYICVLFYLRKCSPSHSFFATQTKLNSSSAQPQPKYILIWIQEKQVVDSEYVKKERDFFPPWISSKMYSFIMPTINIKVEPSSSKDRIKLQGAMCGSVYSCIHIDYM